jgi:hypothetical protein
VIHAALAFYLSNRKWRFTRYVTVEIPEFIFDSFLLRRIVWSTCQPNFMGYATRNSPWNYEPEVFYSSVVTAEPPRSADKYTELSS